MTHAWTVRPRYEYLAPIKFLRMQNVTYDVLGETFPTLKMIMVIARDDGSRDVKKNGSEG